VVLSTILILSIISSHVLGKPASKHTEEGSDELKVQYTRVRVTHCGVPHTEDHVFGVELIDSIVYRNMQRGKTAGLDDLTVEHLQFSHPALFVLFTKLF